jgi:hypothetical protein
MFIQGMGKLNLENLTTEVRGYVTNMKKAGENSKVMEIMSDID